MMPSKKVLAIVSGLLIIAIAGYFLLRTLAIPPFGTTSPFKAVAASQALMIRLAIDFPFDSQSVSVNHLWHLEAKEVQQMLRQLGLSETVTWSDWWLLPEAGDGVMDATYTFIGSAASGLQSAWQEQRYGLEIGFQDGAIFTYGIATDYPLYFARYRNLILIGRYPFQLEKCLSALQHNMESQLGFTYFPIFAKENTSCLAGHTSACVLRPLLFILSPCALAKRPHPKDGIKIHGMGHFYTDLTRQHRPSTRLVERIPGFIPNGQAADFRHVAMPFRSIYPVTSPTDAFPDWAGDGAWEITPSDNNPTGATPQLWVIPKTDSTAYQQFITALSPYIMEDIPHAVFQLQQLREASPFAFLSDRKGWQPWIVDTPDALVVSVYKQDIERYLDYLLAGSNLALEASFTDWHTRVTADFSAQWQSLLRWQLSNDQLTHLLHILVPDAAWSQEGELLLQGKTTEKGLMEVVGHLRTHTAPASTLQVNWTLDLPTTDPISLLPVEQLGTNKRDVFFASTVSGRLWALDDSGAILWEDDFCPDLLSPVWKLPDGHRISWVATTRETIRAWDNQGQPVTINHPAAAAPTAAPVVVQFTNKDDLAILFPASDGKLYGYTADGQPYQGWPASLSGKPVVKAPLMHWQFDTEDLILAWTDTEGWQFFGRFGDYKYGLLNVPERALGLPGYEKNPDQPARSRMVAAVTTGKINVWDLEGNQFPLPVGKGPIDNFLFLPLWGDARGDYLIQRGNLVQLYAYEGTSFTERWQYRLPAAPDTLINAAPVGVLAINNLQRKVWLIDPKGAVWPSFPVAGEQSAFLGGNAREGYYILTLSDNKIYRYGL
ncbi:MAG: hypothetical protein R2795_02780 [Saprospiraceae bacterium]